MNTKSFHIIYSLLAVSVLMSCSDNDWLGDSNMEGKQKIELTGDIEQVPVTRVNDNGFVDGDVMGVYIVDYNGANPGMLQVSGNRGDNVRHTFDEAEYKWNSAYDVYWKDKHTKIDVYGYYPFGNPESIDAYAFTVQRDQSKATEGGEMGGYEASDFLWGKAAEVAPTTSVVRLSMQHRMANARVTLVEGAGFAEGEWASTEKGVLVANLIREATVNLADGTVKASGGVEKTATVPSRVNDEWRAIVVPQTVTAGTTMFSITIGGVAYKFNKNEDFTYIAGKMSNFAIRVDKKENSGQYALTLISESITAWENDLVSHDATAKEYVIINSTAGGLKDAIAAAGKDYAKIKNLKITGRLNTSDFDFMRKDMSSLSALNLKEARVYGKRGDMPWFQDVWDEEELLDVIPQRAFDDKLTLTRIVLPDTLKAIAERAFRQCKNLTGSIIIPEGVESIGPSAFLWCNSLTGTLSLPTTLKYIGGGGAVDIHGAFHGCKFNCELVLPDKLEYIGHNAFSDNSNYYGNLRLPANLTFLGDGAFAGDKNITGDLEIPDKLKYINSDAFNGTGFNGNLILHDGLLGINAAAFEGVPLKGTLNLPKNLGNIGERAFNGCDFSGELKIPSTLVSIGNKAFAYNWRLMGILEFPEGIESIGAGAFANCRSIEGLVFPESLESIGYEASWFEDGGAFQGCYGIGTIVCKGTVPAHVLSGAFDGVAKDNFTLEVPESAIQQYQAASGWCDFKRIAAHHELVCRPAVACALNTEHKQTLVINAEGEWEVESKPDWCELSQTSGSKKTELTLTIKQMAQGTGNRTGEIKFRLKDKDYTHTCAVTQYDYEYGEDQWLTLQKAIRGNNGGINIVFVGDGYNGKDIAEGNYLKDMQEGVEHFFGIEPYKTYRNYFNVYTPFALSTESGVGTVNTIRYNRFNTTFTGGVGLRCDYDEMFRYALNAPTVTVDNLCQTLIVVIPNSTDYGGICQMWEDGSAIAFCPKSTYGYPLDSRGVMQHEAGGHGFGKLGDEYIYHNAFIDFCDCTCCGHVDAVNWAKSLGWYDNLSLTGKMHQVPWSHLIFDSRYSDIVDIFEGGYMHNRGVFRSEQNSCMNNDIPYYSTISRESIVKRIKRYAGEEYSFEEFVANDKRDAGAVTRTVGASAARNVHSHQLPPTIHKGSPLKSLKARKARR